ncbi:EF-Hand 1, calcium-binding site [Sesbania bispinosa]|nr:EF-Hand 1, calcium-binding site [Sesbania bispinosa]
MPVLVPRDKPKTVPQNLIIVEKKIREKLEEADRNKDGRYTRDELKSALKDFGSYIPGWRANRCLVKADANNDGLISGHEIDTLVDYLLARGPSIDMYGLTGGVNSSCVVLHGVLTVSVNVYYN